MNIARFEPWSIVDLLHRDLNRIANRPYAGETDDSPVANWVPAVDIVEEKDRFVLRADVPGVNPADIDVAMDAGILTISGVRQAEDREQHDGLYRYERSSGRFHRRFSLPETADAESITARSKDGILEVTIPKLPEVKARRITVEAA